MVHALVELDEATNRVLNIVKARHGLRGKGEAIRLVVKKYAEVENEPPMRPEFVKKMRRVIRQKSIRADDFAARYMLRE